MEKTKIISALQERLDELEKWRAEDGKKKGNKKENADEEVCPECGGDLLFVEKGIVFCSNCNEYFEYGEVKGK